MFHQFCLKIKIADHAKNRIKSTIVCLTEQIFYDFQVKSKSQTDLQNNFTRITI